MEKMEVEQQQPDRQQKPSQVLENFIPSVSILAMTFFLPESATSAILRPSVLAMNPITEKITKPLIKQVASLNAAKMRVSL